MTDFDFESLIIDIPDYPTPGVVFKDITPIFLNPEAFNELINAIADEFEEAGITKVVGAEARGFMLGAPVAYRLGVGFVPARKPNKLPRETVSVEYELEYGTAELHIHKDAITEDDVILIVDDLIATGGTIIAQVKLVESFGAKLAGVASLLELEFLNPREAISKETDAKYFSLVKVK